jgi:ubiquinone/menaquinone biosynthesis C-methylase UbiE
MVNVRHFGPAGTTSDEPALALFQKQWQLYRKVVDYNYLFHREAYNCLRRILIDEAIQPFRFLDVACGDASASVEALKGMQVASYHGIDLSEAALELASQALEKLTCPVTLDRPDFVEALRDRPESVDVAWIGLSLHHLQTPEKLSVMRQMRSVVGDRGHFLIYENATPDDEDRDAWLRRWDDQKPWWTALAPEEWDAGRAHVYANDFPETTSRWHALGHEAGFGQVRELFVAPTNLFRVYCFRA